VSNPVNLTGFSGVFFNPAGKAMRGLQRATGAGRYVLCMALVGSIIPMNVMGVGAQEKRIAREKEDQRRAIAKSGVKRGSDQAELSTPEVTEIEPPREVRDNSSEETMADRKQQAIYDPYRDGLSSSKPAAHHLDIQG
jgi:hypothetical protein